MLSFYDTLRVLLLIASLGKDFDASRESFHCKFIGYSHLFGPQAFLLIFLSNHDLNCIFFGCYTWNVLPLISFFLILCTISGKCLLNLFVHTL